MRISNPLLPGLLFCMAVAAGENGDFPADDLADRTKEVNEGDLRILSRPPAKPVHHHHNEIRIHDSSLVDGWVQLSQCHSHLDPVGATQIVYRADRIRNLRVVSAAGIKESWVEDSSVQLREISPGGRVCIAAESRALEALGEECFRLTNGPYMRRFLDGYYPMRVSLDIGYPGRLRLTDYAPKPGLEVEQASGRVSTSLWFEGRLHTRFDFCLSEKI